MTQGDREQLASIYWIGGSPCSGKSSIVAWLAERHDAITYSCDDAFWRHAKAIGPDAQPAFYKVTHTAWDALCMRPVDALLQDAIEVYREEWPMVLDDLRALPGCRASSRAS